MKFLIDAQLPPLLSHWLSDRGHQADHVADVALLAAADILVADHAAATGSFIISKDADFIVLRHPDRFGFLWLRCGNATNRSLQIWLEARWPQIEALLEAGERFVEVR